MEDFLFDDMAVAFLRLSINSHLLAKHLSGDQTLVRDIIQDVPLQLLEDILLVVGGHCLG
jgi:hypothetical protein